MILFSGCNNKYSDRMYELIAKQHSNDSCTVTFGSITKEPWDNIYIVSEMVDPLRISNEIGFEYKGKTIPDGERRIIIIKDNKILVEEPFYDSRFSFKGDSLKRRGFVKISYNDTFCSTFNTSIYSHFYFLMKKGN